MFENKDSGNGSPEDNKMAKISKVAAVQTCARRACFIARELTGLEIMPDEMFAASSESLANLSMLWEDSVVAKNKPDSYINFAACMACCEWCRSVRKSDSNEPYELNKKKLSDLLEEVAEIVDGLFPGLITSKGFEQAVYDGVSVTVNGVEANGWKWTQKLNERITILMSLYPILKFQVKNSMKLMSIAEELIKKGE
jgi:hypothetical protein